MKTLNINDPIRGTLKHVSLAVAVVAGLGGTRVHAAPPVNDDFAAAILLSGDSGSVSGHTNADATLEPGEPVCVYEETTNTVWFKWECAEPGSFTISTTGSTTATAEEWDAVACLYTGATLDTLTQVKAQDSGTDETVSLAVTPGTYYIQMGGWENDVATDISLNWSFSSSLVDVSGTINNPNNTIGAGKTANLTAATTFGWQTGNCAIPVITNGYLFTMNSGGGNAYNYTGNISGAGAVKIEGVQYWGGNWNNLMRIGGSTGNTYTGTTLVNPGTTSLEKTSGDALRGTITVGSTNDTARLRWMANDQLNDSADVTLIYFNVGPSYPGRDTYLDLNGYSDRINDLVMETGTYVKTGIGGVLNVKRLIVGGVEMPKKSYTAADGFVQGSGYIDVDDSGPPVIEEAPSEPLGPTPSDGASDVSPVTLTKLDWEDCVGATSYDVYLWKATETKPEVPTASVFVSEYILPAMVDSLATYAWQVVASNTVGDTEGPVWDFSTADRTQVPGNAGVPYSNATHNLDYIVGVGNSGTLLGNFTVHWSGGAGSFSVPLNTNGFILNADTGGGNGGHVASGPISGEGSFVITHGPCTSNAWNNPYTISGATPNTYTGVTTINRGRVVLTKTAGVDALPGTGAITLGSTGQTARLQWNADNQVNDAAVINVLLPTVSSAFEADALLNYLDLNGHADTIASLALPDDGTKTQIRTGAGGVLTVTALTVDGTLMGPGTYTEANSTFVKGSGSVVVPGTGTTYDSWAATHAGGQTAGEDFDHDGVPNGVEYFMNAPDGYTANPGLVAGTVTWPHLNPVASFEVQVSDNLTDWVAADPADVDTTTDPTKVVYTLPTGAPKKFCRLVVTP